LSDGFCIEIMKVTCIKVKDKTCRRCWKFSITYL